MQDCFLILFVRVLGPCICRQGRARQNRHGLSPGGTWAGRRFLPTCRVSVIPAATGAPGWSRTYYSANRTTTINTEQISELNDCRHLKSEWGKENGKLIAAGLIKTKMFSTLKYVTFIFPSLWKFDWAPVSCFLETPDSTRYTHGTFSLSGLFHLTYPTSALEAFPSWFSNSWNLLTVTGQVSLAHMATQPGMSQSCLDRIQGGAEPPGPFPRPQQGAEQHCPLWMAPQGQGHLRFRGSLGWTAMLPDCFLPAFLKRVLSRVFASHHCISSIKNALSLCFSAKVHFLIRG